MMVKVRSLASFQFALSLALASPLAVPAQQPTPAQVQQALQNPSILLQLQSKLAASGLSPEQVRTRLQAAGYPATLLDAYLPGGAPPAGDPTPDVMQAVERLVAIDKKEVSTQGNPAAGGQQAAAAAARSNEPGLEIFGLSVFRKSTSQFDPLLAGPVDASYRLGPRDVLSVFLTGALEQSYTLEITREGFVVIPTVGQVFVANLTLDQATDVLLRRIRAVYSNVGRGSGAATQFYVTVAKLRTNQIFVLGEVANPGSYQISSAATALSALYAAGGPSDRGTLRAVTVRRAGKVLATIDIYDYLISGDASRDVRLENGDIVHVPMHGNRASIDGPMRRPGIYELRGDETLAELVELGGGFATTAARDRLLIRRVLPPQERQPNGYDRKVIDVALATNGSGVVVPRIALERGDEVVVFPVTDRERGRVTVSGNVWLPGAQGLQEGMTVSQALRAAGGLRGDFHPDGLVSRMLPDGRSVQIHLRVRDTTGAVDNDFALQEDDSIRVFSLSNMRTTRGVYLGGAVREGGRFAFREGMTLRDVVLVARGFPDSTNLLPEVILWRLQPDLTRRQLRAPLWDTVGVAVSRLVLMEGDSVRIFNQGEFRPDRFVRVAGAVREERTVPWHEGLSLRDVVQLAGGLAEGASLERAEVARLPAARQNGHLADTLHVPLDSTYLFERGPDGRYLGPPGLPAPVPRAPEVELKPYDHVLILRQPEWTLPQTVTVTGQVLYPGTYTLRSTEERLADLIDRAGGLTSRAYPGGFTFNRPFGTIGRVGVDLETAMRRRSSRDNVVLVTGDSIHVPIYQPVVQVQGAVNAPISVPYVRGKNMRYYVHAAGGETHNAEIARAFVRQPNGQVESYNSRWWLLPDGEPEPRAGATVVIPVQDPNAKKDWAQITGAVAQVLVSLVAIIAIAAR